MVERFDGPRAVRPISIEMMEPPHFPRIWLGDASGNELVQIQRDRLMHNWRHTAIGSEYPRYPRLRKEFASDWAVMDSFLRDHRLGELLPTQCEVVYVNLIEADGGLLHADSSRYFSFFAPAVHAQGLSEFEAVSFSMTSVAKSATDQGAHIGRLFVEVSSGVNPATRLPTYQFSLTLRGAPPTRDLEGVLSFFDFARTRIVCVFAELTTPQMHEIWEKQV